MESRNKALSHLRKSLRAGRGEELPMQKVSVMAADEKGLEEGLEKAKEILPKISKMSEEMDSEEYKCDSEDCENGNCVMCMAKNKSEESEDKEMESEEKSEDLDNMSSEELKAMVKSLKSRLNY